MRRLLLSIAVVRLSFNPRICKRCDCFWSFCYPLGYCFNPRICKRCDKTVNAYLFTVNVVSIHASVKDATQEPTICYKTYFGFNPRICKRCDHGYEDTLCFRISFNPRICKRCDKSIIFVNTHIGVSIHASVKDATCLKYILKMRKRFQSTHL